MKKSPIIRVRKAEPTKSPLDRCLTLNVALLSNFAAAEVKEKDANELDSSLPAMVKNEPKEQHTSRRVRLPVQRYNPEEMKVMENLKIKKERKEQKPVVFCK